MGLERFLAILPYDAFEIETPYTPAEVAERIQKLIEEHPVFTFTMKVTVKRTLMEELIKRSLFPFLGTVDLHRFHLYPAIHT